jgi:hypothetical protein
VDRLADRRVLPPDIFTHFYHVRRHGNAAVHGSHSDAGSAQDAMFTIIGATVQIVTWHLGQLSR